LILFRLMKKELKAMFFLQIQLLLCTKYFCLSCKSYYIILSFCIPCSDPCWNTVIFIIIILLAKPAKSIFALAHVNKSSRNTADILATRHPPAPPVLPMLLAGYRAASTSAGGSLNTVRIRLMRATHHVTYHVSRDLSVLIYRYYIV
jgi:hypothetical protein